MTDSKHSQQLLYNRVGGEKGLERLVETFYDIIEKDAQPDAHLLYLLHLKGHGISHTRIEQFNFLSGFFGGPNLYLQRYGHANVRTMHEHVEIPPQASEAWLNCMAQAIDEVGLDLDTKEVLMKHFTRVATMLINRAA